MTILAAELRNQAVPWRESFRTSVPARCRCDPQPHGGRAPSWPRTSSSTSCGN